MISVVKFIAPEILLLSANLTFFSLASIIFNNLSTLILTFTYILFFSIWQIFIFNFVWPLIHKDDVSYDKRSNRISFKLALLLVIGIWLSSHLICVLMGAPFIENLLETTTWAFLVSALISIPTIFFIGTDVDGWLRELLCGQYSSNIGHRFVYLQTAGVVIGSWASSVTIPLDWDRPWQKWPIPLLAGAVFGYCIALIFNLVVTVKNMKSSKFH